MKFFPFKPFMHRYFCGGFLEDGGQEGGCRSRLSKLLMGSVMVAGSSKWEGTVLADSRLTVQHTLIERWAWLGTANQFRGDCRPESRILWRPKSSPHRRDERRSDWLTGSYVCMAVAGVQINPPPTLEQQNPAYHPSGRL